MCAILNARQSRILSLPSKVAGPVPRPASNRTHKRKRSGDGAASIASQITTPSEPLRKRHQIVLSSLAPQDHLPVDDTVTPVEHWTRFSRWPKRYFDSDVDTMQSALARKTSVPSLRRSNSQASVSQQPTPSDQRPREENGAGYDSRYPTLLASKRSFMKESASGPPPTARRLCRELLEHEQQYPQHSLFRDEVFYTLCSKLEEPNEARVIQDLARLLVPSAESLATDGATHLDCLVENVNEGWNNAVPFTKTRPQPDYSVGFGLSAFTPGQ